jgi:hypothetical protein
LQIYPCLAINDTTDRRLNELLSRRITMNAKVLSSLAAALVVSSITPPAIAEPLGEHPAVVVARTWNTRGIDPNTFIVAHPASTRWLHEAPKTADKLAHASVPPEFHWSAAIGTGQSARTTAKSDNMTSSVKPNTDGTNSAHRVSASPHWTATIGSGRAATSTSTVTDTKEPLSSGMKLAIAPAHWTSRIGSGHPFDSNSPVTYASLVDAQ